MVSEPSSRIANFFFSRSSRRRSSIFWRMASSLQQHRQGQHTARTGKMSRSGWCDAMHQTEHRIQPGPQQQHRSSSHVRPAAAAAAAAPSPLLLLFPLPPLLLQLEPSLLLLSAASGELRTIVFLTA